MTTHTSRAATTAHLQAALHLIDRGRPLDWDNQPTTLWLLAWQPDGQLGASYHDSPPSLGANLALARLRALLANPTQPRPHRVVGAAITRYASLVTSTMDEDPVAGRLAARGQLDRHPDAVVCRAVEGVLTAGDGWVGVSLVTPRLPGVGTLVAADLPSWQADALLDLVAACHLGQGWGRQ